MHSRTCSGDILSPAVAMHNKAVSISTDIQTMHCPTLSYVAVAAVSHIYTILYYIHTHRGEQVAELVFVELPAAVGVDLAEQRCVT